MRNLGTGSKRLPGSTVTCWHTHRGWRCIPIRRGRPGTRRMYSAYGFTVLAERAWESGIEFGLMTKGSANLGMVFHPAGQGPHRGFRRPSTVAGTPAVLR